MAFSDPQAFPINAVANSLARTASGINTGVFTKDDGNVKLTVTSAYNKRVRQTARVDFRKVASDPLVPSNNVSLSMAAYLVVDTPTVGFTPAEKKQIVDALTAWLAAGTNTAKLLGGEN
jgi:hypothetical protein